MTIKFNDKDENALRELSVFQLADLALCSSPDTGNSPGAEYLDTVRLTVIENFLYDSWGTYPEDEFNSVADGSLPVYNYDIAKTFTDLGAWGEDVSDMLPGVTGDNAIIKLMQVALCRIGERLARSLFDAYKHTLEELEEVDA
jgi:hypothetical protein